MSDQALREHTATQCKKDIIKLAPGIYGAVGYAASCMYMVEGDDSVTIIDTTESTSAAQNIWAELQRRADKPVGRIIYTHSHRDHISGASVFAPEGGMPIYASATFTSDLVDVDETRIAPNKALGRRTQAQFGMGLTPDQRISLGCGPGDRPMEGLGAGFVPPSVLIPDDQDIDLDGVDARFIMAPGETADHMVVWLPEQRILFCGDNWYHTFPNLYAIRGTPYRDFAAWAKSLLQLAELQPEVLAPGHTRPIFGAAEVQEALTTTSEAITWVMSETARMMNEGFGLDDIQASVTLPDHLRSKPWLQEFYGKVGWSARAFAVGTLGWYDGNPTHLSAVDSKTRAETVAGWLGGIDKLHSAAKDTADPTMRLELWDHLLTLGQPVEAQKAEDLERLAQSEINATARNTYLWEAKRLWAADADRKAREDNA